MNSNKIIDGKEIAGKIRETLAHTIDIQTRIAGRPPGLCTIIVGEDKASQIYVRNKIKQATSIGMATFQLELTKNTTEEDLAHKVREASQNPLIDGILIQLPLPRHIDERAIIREIAPSKDVDAFTPINIGLLALGHPHFVPCTPKGIMRLIKNIRVNLAGLHAVVVGRSNIVGKPIAQLLLDADATVTICHSKTINLKEITRSADILIAAVGKEKIIKAEHIKPGAIVVDVGINRFADGSLVGDVDFEAVLPLCSAITPVPGGVGPMTIAMLLENTVLAHALHTEQHRNIHGIKTHSPV